MKTLHRILTVSIVTISLMTSLTAQAGFFDLFRSNDVSAKQSDGGSFNALAALVYGVAQADEELPTLIGNAIAPVNSPVGGITKTIRRNYTVQLSAYTSEVAQTDASPFITADGSYVRDGIVATNMFPFGTAIKIPSLYGDKIFTVHDRMNTRYQKNVDIWFADKTAALKLGRRTVQIEVIR
jgi:3D (Asp-Asp-Asp) domain-containing protein